MIKKRIGNDFTLRWTVYVNKGDISLEDVGKENIKLTLTDPTGAPVSIGKYSVEGNNILIRLYGYQMEGNCRSWRLGSYSLHLTLYKGEAGQTTVDLCDAFQLVGKSCQEGGDSQDVEVDTAIDLESSDLMLPYIASPLILDDEGILTDKRTGKKYKLVPLGEDGNPEPDADLVSRVELLEQANAKMQQAISAEDADGNGVPDGVDRLNRMEESIPQPLTEEELNEIRGMIK